MLSVTRVIGHFVSFENVPPDKLREAAERGTEVHAACAAHVGGVWSPVSDRARGYFESFKRYADREIKAVLWAEGRLEDRVLGYYGHPDLIFEDQRGQVVLLDNETPVGFSKSWPVQIAAYWRLGLPQWGIEKGGTLRLDPDGGVPKVDWVEPQDRNGLFNVFLSALNAVRYFQG